MTSAQSQDATDSTSMPVRSVYISAWRTLLAGFRLWACILHPHVPFLSSLHLYLWQRLHLTVFSGKKNLTHFHLSPGHLSTSHASHSSHPPFSDPRGSLWTCAAVLHTWYCNAWILTSSNSVSIYAYSLRSDDWVQQMCDYAYHLGLFGSTMGSGMSDGVMLVITHKQKLMVLTFGMCVHICLPCTNKPCSVWIRRLPLPSFSTAHWKLFFAYSFLRWSSSASTFSCRQKTATQSHTGAVVNGSSRLVHPLVWLQRAEVRLLCSKMNGFLG